MKKTITNRLIQETSPYLKQHAHNPVDWHPWCQEALDIARMQNKPILLSIGYAACHWCHVMAHESFEDQETADLMNKLFINIKVDREERPDLDKIYQTAHYLLTQQSGGWPLTIFLTPDDLTPFFSGTYFPRDARHQLPAFKDILKTISTIYQNRQEDIQLQNASLRNILTHLDRNPDSTIHLTHQPLQLAIKSLQQNYDSVHGGFGLAPKFPQPSKLELLFLLNSPMLKETLYAMANGGIYDQLGGGFFRYTVDAGWKIPHFEKMLYDNAQLLFLYSLAAKDYSEPYFANTAKQTAFWVMNYMQSDNGGYFSSLDADSEGHEGKFYLWDKDEIKSILNKTEYSLIEKLYALDHAPNFEEKWHFFIEESLENIAVDLKIPLSEAEVILSSAKNKLLSIRNKRIHPHCDDKILTAWNSLMIKGMLTAGHYLNEHQFIDSSQRALRFIYKNLWINKRLIACFNTSISAYLDDYVFLIDALLTSLQIKWNTSQLEFVIELADTVLNHFSDQATGGFFFTANDHEKLLYRPKIMMDESTPAGNGIAVRVLLTLGYLLGETRYLDAAEKTLKAAWPAMAQFPAEHSTLLLGLKDFVDPTQIIIIRGEESTMNHWRDQCKKPQNYVFCIPNDEKNLPGYLNEKKPQSKACAYVCQGMQCLSRIDNLNELKDAIK